MKRPCVEGMKEANARALDPLAIEKAHKWPCVHVRYDCCCVWVFVICHITSTMRNKRGRVFSAICYMMRKLGL